GERIGDFRDAGAEIRSRIIRGSELLVAVGGEGRHRVGKLRIRWDAGNVERGSRRRRQLHRAPLDGSPCISYAHFVQHVGREGVLIIRSKRPRRRILRTDGHTTGRDGPTPVRKGGPPGGVTAEVRQPSERLIPAGRKLMIEAYITLILVVDFVGCPAVVVRGSGGCWQRVAVEKRQRDRIHGASRNRVVRKLLTSIPNRRRRVGDVVAEET